MVFSEWRNRERISVTLYDNVRKLESRMLVSENLISIMVSSFITALFVSGFCCGIRVAVMVNLMRRMSLFACFDESRWILILGTVGTDFHVLLVICSTGSTSVQSVVCLITVAYGSVVHVSAANNTARDIDPNKVYLSYLTYEFNSFANYISTIRLSGW